MLRRFFNPDSLIWKPLGVLGDLVVLSLLWAVCCMPLVTVGPASAALYDTAVFVLRQKKGPPFPHFFSVFRRELKDGVLSTLLCAAGLLMIGLLFYAALRLFPGFAERGGLVSVVAVLLAFFSLAVLCWVWPTLSRFTLSPARLLGTSLRLAMGHSLRSAGLAVLWAAALYFSLRYVSPLFFLPGLAAFLCSYLIEPIFRPYEEAALPDSGQDEAVS